MNPMTNMKNVKKLSEQELHTSNKTSWHDQYKDSAWIFIGGLPYDLTEGDIICIFSQYGEVVNINLVRDKETGKSRGFCFLCYEDQRSTVLAVDNFNGIKILKRTIRVDHVQNYKVPKDPAKLDEVTKMLHDEGCGPESRVLSSPKEKEKQESSHVKDENELFNIRLPERLPIYTDIKKENDRPKKEKRKKKKEKKRKKSEKKHKKRKRNSSSDDSSSTTEDESSSCSDSDDEIKNKSKKKKRKKNKKQTSDYSEDEKDNEKCKKYENIPEKLNRMSEEYDSKDKRNESENKVKYKRQDDDGNSKYKKERFTPPTSRYEKYKENSKKYRDEHSLHRYKDLKNFDRRDRRRQNDEMRDQRHYDKHRR